jgi:hypothetical protein
MQCDIYFTFFLAVSAQALAIKRQMRQPRLVLPRLKAREIRLARTGANTQALLRKYAACARQQRPPPRRQLVKPSKKAMPATSTASPSTSDVFELKSMRELTVPSPMACQAPTFDDSESPGKICNQGILILIFFNNIKLHIYNNNFFS